MKTVLRWMSVVIILGFWGSCELFEDEVTLSKKVAKERMTAFQNDLNTGDYGTLRDNFHPSMPSYNSYRDKTIFTTGPLKSGNKPFTFGCPKVEGTKVTGSFKNGHSAHGSYSAEMKKDGDGWKIYSLKITIGDNSYTIKSLN